MAAGVLEVEGRRVPVPNLDKLLWAEPPIHKRDLLGYYIKVAPALLPHLADRPLVRHRMPEGIEGFSFWEKDLPDFAPAWVRRFADTGADGKLTTYPVVGDLASLVWVANLASIELHPWLSRVQTADCPDFAVFDLDPFPPAGFDDTVEIALLVKQALDALGLRSYPKTSGATGIQVYVPLEPVHPYATVRRFVEAVGQLVADAYPDRITWEWEVAARTGRIRVDYTQNVRGKTIASVYSVRPLPGAPVSTPLEWEEVQRGLDPAAFTLRTIPEHVRRHGDLFAPVLSGGQELGEASRTLGLPA